jgi:hypothetical protein
MSASQPRCGGSLLWGAAVPSVHAPKLSMCSTHRFYLHTGAFDDSSVMRTRVFLTGDFSTRSIP